MVGFSGFSCLIYQIVWMRQVGLVFGSTSQAAALTLAVFFAGLAAGGWFWGGRSVRIARPLRVYAWLELGIAASGLLVMGVPGWMKHWYPMVYGVDGDSPALFLFRLLGTFLVVFPAAFLMGGTLPVLGQWVIRNRSAFGVTSARLYAVNTAGAAAGAFTAAFVLIWHLGFRGTCMAAMLVSLMVAGLAFILARKSSGDHGGANAGLGRQEASPTRKNADAVDEAGKLSLSRTAIRGMAFSSGFLVLLLEVLWTRMFAQVHENSVYSFSAVLIIVLVCLACGAWLASRLARAAWTASFTLMMLVASGGGALCITPFLFMGMTKNLSMLPTSMPLGGYVVQLLGTGFASVGPACVLLGAVFPYLMKAEEAHADQAGKSLGHLAAINTLGAILGALAGGFVLLPWLGFWGSMQAVSAVYLVVALLLPGASSVISRPLKAVTAVMLVLLLTVLDPGKIPVAPIAGPDGTPEKVVETWDGSDCTVTVTKGARDHTTIRINANYSLGSTGAFGLQVFQSRIPLLAYPGTDSVFFLGMGTGITAGEALNREDFPNVGKVVACELSPAVIEASRKYFAGGLGGQDMTQGLFTDSRAKVLARDGRNHLMASNDAYAMINADLFLPYRNGTGNLYGREHFEQVRKRLKPGGVFVQWLPLYQVSEREFGIIARTMLEVFPQVTLWRGSFQPGGEMVAFFGHADDQPLPPCGMDAARAKRDAVEGAGHYDMDKLQLPINAQTVLLFYCGNLSRAADMFSEYPVNTEDRPVIEFGSPRSLHRDKNAERPHFVGERFAVMVDRLLARTPPDEDPFLQERDEASRKLPFAGAAFSRAWIAGSAGDEEEWMRQWELFLSAWLGEQENRE